MPSPNSEHICIQDLVSKFCSLLKGAVVGEPSVSPGQIWGGSAAEHQAGPEGEPEARGTGQPLAPPASTGQFLH